MDSGWKSLYRIGAVAALIALSIFRRNCGAEYSLLRLAGVLNSGPAMAPASAIDWFELLQENCFVGLIYLDLFDLINYALVGLIFLALYGALRRADRGLMVIATASGLVGVAVYFASNQAFAMLGLSDHYAAAPESQQAAFLAAGEALLAIHSQGAGIRVSLFLVLLGGLLISIVMLRSRVFSKTTAWMGILANAIGLGFFIALAFDPALVAIPASISAPFRLIWYFLIALRLLKLGSSAEQEAGR